MDRLPCQFKEGASPVAPERRDRLPFKRFDVLAPWLHSHGQKLVFAISEVPVNLYEFALLFRDTLHCPDALFLDGTVASLYSTALKRSDFRADLGPIFAITE